ncbi:GNAT family N-acetyltransferase [Kutzneria albida]|uniref:N-acetyltransferase domain-containing protein n=1 Tax=Kutzneria albida DSM 43870 TaxID=1449976 RepID=W5W9A3_9PSEU|nr:GNAT family N-acetyltransferase [Kutzneria albida]AHH94769.1 hypothetical protein KALB_1396 [Kutzneria albida DSM 43870]
MIRPGGPADSQAVLGLLDEAVRWLVAQGRTGQWGTEPFSTNPTRVATVRGWMNGQSWIAEADGRVAGALAVGEALSYVPPADVPELYIRGLVGGQFPAARGAGRLLLAQVEAEGRRLGVTRLRVDCYAGDDRALVAFYESAGFTATDPFTVGDWPGQVLERRLR